MDSLTQVVLGSTVSYAVFGHRLGRKALLVGAAFGTLPDLDVLINFGGDIENFVYHRSFSHSLLVQLLASPLLAWLLLRMNWAKTVSITRWSVGIFLILSTHALLDSFTVYGTQLLWPLSTYPFSTSSIFIIDPLYTVPLLVACVLLCFARMRPYAAIINTTALIISSLYLAWGLGAKALINDKIDNALAKHNITFTHFVSTPTPFNTLLWRAVAVTNQGHYEIYASIFDTPDDIDIQFYPTDNTLLAQFKDTKRVRLLQLFTKGLYGVYQQDKQVVLSDLRMGLEGYYTFSFVIAEQHDQHFTLGSYQKIRSQFPREKLQLIWSRITDPSVELSSVPPNYLGSQ